ncbi:MAG TPA: hypothetical protein VJ911_02050 [Cryomorphaceae bacterium]|nr:hypothetical protein [Cryomorphaceae bacterium]
MNFKPLLFAIIFTANCAYAQKSQIIGFSEDWIGREVRILSNADPVSGTYDELLKTTIDQGGKFTAPIAVENTTLVWLMVNRFKAPVYIKPEESYELQIGGSEENPFIDTWNKGELVYTFSYLPEGDPNREIMAFDQAYYNLFLDNPELIGTSAMKAKVKAFETEWAGKYSDKYLSHYIKYSIAKMKMSAGFPKQSIYETYLSRESEIETSNAGFRDFFNTFYTDYFDQYNVRFKDAEIHKFLGEKADIEGFFERIREDEFMTNLIIQQMVVLKSINEAYGDSRYSKKALMQVLKEIEKASKTEIVATIAQNIRTKWEKNEASFNMEYIKEKFASDLEYQPGIENVFVITNAKSKASEKEFYLLADLSATYSEYFRVTECTVGKREKAERHRPWPVAEADDAYGLLETLDVYSFPHFLRVDKAGKIVENGMVKPSEGLEKSLYQMKVRSEAKDKIKVGK